MSSGPNDNSLYRTRVKASVDRFVDIEWQSDLEAAHSLSQLKVDIAVDLMGLTQGSRTGIFAQRPAPLQVAYLGYPGTMGSRSYDYLIADRFVIPAEQQVNYAERIAYLPDTFQVNDLKRAIADQPRTRSAYGLPAEGFVFCCFNNSYKITPFVFDVWMRLLKRVKGSVLWLLADSPLVDANLKREAAARGVSPERLVFAPRLAYAEHLSRYGAADLFLDTLPFNAGATASDALWAGLPIVTCVGSAYAARMAGSLQRAIGLSEMITESMEEYESLTYRLATEPGLISVIRSKLGRNRSTHPLFNLKRFRRHIEEAYFAMWHRHLQGLEPTNISIPPCEAAGSPEVFRAN